MKRMRRQFDAARRDYDALSYDGDLGDLVSRDEPVYRIAWVRWLPIAAAAAVVAMIAFIGWDDGQTETTKEGVVSQVSKMKTLPVMSVAKTMNLPKARRMSGRLKLNRRSVFQSTKRMKFASLSTKSSVAKPSTLKSTVQSKLKLKMKSLTPLRRFRHAS